MCFLDQFPNLNQHSYQIFAVGYSASVDQDYAAEIQGDLRLTGGIYAFYDGTARSYSRKYLDFGNGVNFYAGGDTVSYAHVFKTYSGTEIFRVAPTGVISGSAISTGSFGDIEAHRTIRANRRIVINDDNIGNQAKLYVDGGSSNTYPVYITSDQASGTNVTINQESAVNSMGLLLQTSAGNNVGQDIAWSAGGTNSSIRGVRGSASYGGLGLLKFQSLHNSVLNDILHLGNHKQQSTTYDDVHPSFQLLSGSLEVVNGNISGSVTSTGSFGRVEVNSISASLYQGQIGSRYVHSQTSDSTTWVISHNIGHKYPVVTVYDTDDQMILPETGTATDSDTFTLTFNEAIQGKAVVSVGGIGENAGANYIFTQGSSTTNWRVTHSLSQQYPNITVFDENNEVIIPETITATSDNHTDIVFSDGQSGYANFSIGSGIPNISSENAGKFLKVRSGGQGVEWVSSTTDVSGSMSVSGSIIPDADNHHDLGSESKRWANLYTGDIELSNEGTEGNEVDGTTGSWTIQEGEDDLYLLNRKNGKKYRFKLEEIT